MSHELLSEADRTAIVEAYGRGEKLSTIQQRHSVPRSTIYWVLEQAQVAPNRMQRGRRLVGNDQELAQLYDLIEAQAERIAELEARLGE